MTENTKKLQEAAQRPSIKISSKSVDYLTTNLDLERHEAIRLLRANEGDLDRSLERYLLGQDDLGKPEFVL